MAESFDQFRQRRAKEGATFKSQDGKTTWSAGHSAWEDGIRREYNQQQKLAAQAAPIDPTKPMDSPNIGTISESQSAALHDRYMSPDILKQQAANRSSQMNKLLASAMGQAQGLNGAENAAIRQNAMSSINSQNQSALRALRGGQAASGVRGGLAMAQMQQQRGAAAEAAANMEQKLAQENITAKREGTRAALGAVTNQENIERDTAANKLRTILLGRAENAGIRGAELQAQASGGGGK